MGNQIFYQSHEDTHCHNYPQNHSNNEFFVVGIGQLPRPALKIRCRTVLWWEPLLFESMVSHMSILLMKQRV